MPHRFVCRLLQTLYKDATPSGVMFLPFVSLHGRYVGTTVKTILVPMCMTSDGFVFKMQLKSASY